MCDWGNFAMSKQSISLLQNHPVFGGINHSTIELILRLSSLVHKKKGEYFFREGEPGCSMYVMQKGSGSVVKLSGQTEYFVNQINEGDCFGEMAVIDHCPRSATVKADVDASAIEISTSVLLEVYKHDLEQFTMIQMNMGREVSRRLRDASDRLFAHLLEQDSTISK